MLQSSHRALVRAAIMRERPGRVVWVAWLRPLAAMLVGTRGKARARARVPHARPRESFLMHCHMPVGFADGSTCLGSKHTRGDPTRQRLVMPRRQFQETQHL